MFPLQESDQFFAQFGAQIGCVRRRIGADQNAHFDRVRPRIGHLDAGDFAIRQLRLRDQLGRLLADAIDRSAIVEVKQHAADVIRRVPRPVVERFFDEISERHDQPPQVPQADHHVGRRDFLDPAVLVLHGDGVFETDRLRHGELDAGNQVAQHRPCRKASNDAGNARGRKQADAVLTHGVERHQREAGGDQDDDRIEHAHQHAYLGDVLARQQIVFDVEAETQQVDRRRDLERGRSRSSRAEKSSPATDTAPIRFWFRARAASSAARRRAPAAAGRAASGFWSRRASTADRAAARAVAGAATARIAACNSHATTTALTSRTKETAHGGAKESAFLNALNSDCRFCDEILPHVAEYNWKRLRKRLVSFDFHAGQCGGEVASSGR